MARWVVAALLAASATAPAAALDQPTLTLEFEDGFDGAGRAGPVVATVEGKPERAPGKLGQALLSGPSTGYLSFATEGIVKPTAGSVEAWVCPVDWDGKEERFHTFFDVRGRGALYLYKYHQGGLLMLSCEHVDGPYVSASAPIAEWKPGEWHHIVGTWRHSKQCVYVDGKLVGTTPPSLPTALDPTFRIGDHPWHIERTSSSLIDRVRIYDRALSGAEVASHFAGDYDARVPFGPEVLDLADEVSGRDLKAQVTLELMGGSDADEGGVRVTFALAQKGAEPEWPAAIALTDGAATMAIDLAGKPPGSYEIGALVTCPGHEPIRLTRALDIPSTDWRGNTIGLDDVVLPPWTPVAVGTDKLPVVSCWGREYQFGGGGLPSQITSAREPLLARPIAVVARVAGQDLTWAAGTAEVVSARDTAAEVDGRATAECGDGAATLRAHTRTEYDGLALVDLGLDLPEGAQPKRLSIEIPVRGQVALYRHRWAASWAGETGNLPAGDGVIDSTRFIPYVWLGDNDRGLFWFCETSEQWPNSESPDAVELVRQGDEVVLRLNILAEGQTLPAGWKLQFGLQGTPVKPLPADWRKRRLAPANGANLEVLWPTPTADSEKYFGYAEAADPEVFAKRIEASHAKGMAVVPYSCLSFLSGASGEFRFFGDQWGMGGGDSGSSDVAAYGAVFQMVCPKAPGYADFIVAKNREFMEKYGLNGFYHDNTHPYACAKEITGCGYQRGGATVPTYPILAYRSLYRRLYAMAKQRDPSAFLMAHMSGKVTIPVLAYEDSYLDGEHFRGQVKDSYMDLLPLDTFRAEFMGRQWGIVPYFLPEFAPPYSEQVEPTRGLAALLMIHDVPPWAIWCNKAVFDEALAALDAFGYAEADFVPYFDPKPPATTEMADVLVSAYRLPGKALVIAANLSREDRAGTLHIDAARLGLEGEPVLSWPDRTAVAAEDGTIQLDIPRLGYRMLFVGTE